MRPPGLAIACVNELEVLATVGGTEIVLATAGCDLRFGSGPTACQRALAAVPRRIALHAGVLAEFERATIIDRVLGQSAATWPPASTVAPGRWRASASGRDGRRQELARDVPGRRAGGHRSCRAAREDRARRRQVADG
jgi:hypothetical protein